MKHKKPDRWTRTVLAEMKKQDTPRSTCIWLNGPDVVKLLRKEHRAVMQIVKHQYERTQKQSRTHKDVSIQFGLDCQAGMCKIILSILAKRAT